MIFDLRQIQKLKDDNIITNVTYDNLIKYFDSYVYDNDSFSEEDRELIKIENKNGNFDIFSDKDLLTAQRDGIITSDDLTVILNALRSLELNKIKNGQKIGNSVKQKFFNLFKKYPLPFIAVLCLILFPVLFILICGFFTVLAGSGWVVFALALPVFIILFIIFVSVLFISVILQEITIREKSLNSKQMTIPFFTVLFICYLLLIKEFTVQYFAILIPALLILFLYNKFKNNPLLTYSIIFIAIFTIIFDIYILLFFSHP